MSGGVDSTVAVSLLLERGFSVAGATMKLLPDCEKQVERAANAAKVLGIDFYVFDFEKEFKDTVREYFCRSYAESRTPNPCVVCNKLIKFGLFFDKAMELGFDYVATGHYAVITPDGEDRIWLRKAVCTQKDQSYFLFKLSQDVLKKVIFPLGDIESKEKVREIARSRGVENSEERDSQDICFVPDGDYIGVIEDYYREKGIARRPGNFVDVDGNVIGTHGGMERFTIGQRKGVGMTLGEEPMYVLGKRPEDGAVIMGRDELLHTDTLYVAEPSFPWLRKNEAVPESKAGLTVKTRSGQRTVPASIQYDPVTNMLTAYLEKPVRAAAPGQFAVFYDGDRVFCGGEIKQGPGR